MKKPLLLILLCLTTISATVHAQPAKTGAWYNYFGNQAWDRWNWHNEIQYRNYNMGGDLDQLLLRTGIGYNLTPNNNNVLIGYAYIFNQPYVGGTDERSTFAEHRIFQQFTTKQQFGRFNIQHRYRLEERFFSSSTYTLRFRYQISVNIPLNKPFMEQNAIYLSAYNETFLTSKLPYFDRNRLYGGIGYCIRKDLKLEAGFMQQNVPYNLRNQLMVSVFNNIPLRKDD